MAISSIQQTGIMKVVIGLFNAAPGGVYLSELANLVEGGVTTSQLADILADSPVFKTGILAGNVTIDDQVNVLMKNFGVTADSDPTSAGSQAKTYFTTQLTNGVGFGKIVFDAGTFLSTTTDTTFSTAQTLYNNKALVAAAYSKTSSSTDLSTLQNVLSKVTGTTAYTDADVANILSGAGNSIVLTTGVDKLIGTAGSDNFIGDDTGTNPTVSAVDELTGNGGNDTFQHYLASAATTVTNPKLNGIANLYINGGAAVSADLSKLTGVTSVQIDNLGGNATYTLTGAQALTVLNDDGAVINNVTAKYGATDTSASISLSNVGTSAGSATVDVQGAALATLNLTSIGGKNYATLTNSAGVALNKLVIGGDQKLTLAESLNGVKTIDASSSTGGVKVDVSGAAVNAAFAFTGGSGDDTIVLANDALGNLTSGAQLDGGGGNNKIGLNDAALTTAEYSALNAAKNFGTIGLNAAVTVDASQLTSIKSFSLDSDAAQVVSNMSTGSSLSVTAAHASDITTTSSVGVHDLALAIGTSTTSGLTVGGTVNIGQDSVALSSLGDGTAANTINQLAVKNNSVYTITGSNDLTISSIADATSSGSKYDASGFTGKLNITGNSAVFTAGSSLGDIIIGGSGDDTINVGANSSTVTGNGGNDTFNVSSAVAGATSNYATTTITDFTEGDTIKFGGTAGAFATTKVDLSGAASLSAALDLLAAGSNSDVHWGVYGGNTYVVDDVGAGATVDAADTIVKLTGTLDLSTSTFDAGAHTVTFA